MFAQLPPAQATGLWGQLAAAKTVVVEPRGTGEEFDAVMAQFYGGVRAGRGALFFAVCRGKARQPSCLSIPSCRPSRAYTYKHPGRKA